MLFLSLIRILIFLQVQIVYLLQFALSETAVQSRGYVFFLTVLHLPPPGPDGTGITPDGSKNDTLMFSPFFYVPAENGIHMFSALLYTNILLVASIGSAIPKQRRSDFRIPIKNVKFATAGTAGICGYKAFGYE